MTYFTQSITSGNHIGSDHIPIITKISTTPIRTLKPPTLDINTLNIQEYKDQLSSLELPLLDNKPTQTIDDNIENIITNIKTATNNNCTIKTCKLIQTYTPTNRIKQKVRQLQAATNHCYIYGNPSLERLRAFKEELSDIIKGVDREKSAVFKELTQSFRTYELRGQAKKKKKSSNRIKDKQVPHTVLQKLSPKSLTSPLNKDIDLRG